MRAADDMDVPDEEMREAAGQVVQALCANDVPTHADMARARDYLRAAELARAWLATCEATEPKRLTPFRSFVLGYLAAIKDRV